MTVDWLGNRIGLVIILLSFLLGILLIFNRPFGILGLTAILVTMSIFKLLTLSQGSWWKLWLAIIFLSAFGPFLDVVTGQPINWLIGLVVILLFLLSQFARLFARPNGEFKKSSLRVYLPVVGAALSIYMLYSLAQAFRPDVETWSTLLALRAPLIGFAGYFLTLYGFRENMDSGEVISRVRQLLLLFIFVSLVVAAYGVFQFIVGFERLQAWGLVDPSVRYLHYQRNLGGGTPIFRVFSTMRRNEVLGVLLYLNMVACAVALRLNLHPRWLILTSLGLSSLSLILSFSLTSIVMLFIWLGLVVISTRSRQALRVVIIFAFLGLLSIFLVNSLTGGIIQARFAEHLLDTEEDIGRVRMFMNWMEEMIERPIFTGMLGTGICTSLDEGTVGRLSDVLGLAGIQIRDGFECGWQREVHDNWYATHSLEIGWLGLLLFWLVFLLIGISIIPKLRRHWRQPEAGAWLMLALGVLALWPAGFVGALIMYMPITLYFWSFAALIEVGSLTHS